jgi:hypothetical protein
MAKRPRGKARECVCREEPLRETRETPIITDGEWNYLFGICGGGARRRRRGREVEWEPFTKEQGERVRNLPARRVDLYTSILEALTEQKRRRVKEIEALIEHRSADLVAMGAEIGAVLLEAKEILGYKDFAAWLYHLKLSSRQAYTCMRIAEVSGGSHGSFQMFKKLGQEKLILLARLSPAKRQELIDDGVPLNGAAKPLTEVTYRELNTYVRSVNGKDPRGRKRIHPEKPPRPTQRFGMPIHIVEAFEGAARALAILEQAAKEKDFEEYGQEAVAMVRLWWEQIYGCVAELNETHGLKEVGWR